MLQLVLFARQGLSHSADLKNRQGTHQDGWIQTGCVQQLLKTHLSLFKGMQNGGFFRR